MGLDLGISQAKVSVGGNLLETVFARATLDLCHALAAKVLVYQKGCGSRSPLRERQDSRERHPVLDRLVGALPEMRKHWVRGVTEEGEQTPGAGRQWLAVVESPPESRFNLRQHRLDPRIPACKCPT